MSIQSLENQLNLTQVSLMLGSMILGYQVAAKLINRIAHSHISFQKFQVTFSLLGLITALQCSIITPNLTFLGLCVADVVLSNIQLEKKSLHQGILPSFTRDLVEEARRKSGWNYLGHEKSIKELEVILLQMEKNNGILVGPPGVGKSAVFESIAWKIAHKKFPPTSPFFNKRLIGTSVTDILGGTLLRGDLELRVGEMLDLAKHDPTVIYVIDEIHKIVGAGATMRDSSGDIANLLKEPLARPGLKVLGATTPAEYLSILNDPTLNRRFKEVKVYEPKPLECLEMLQKRRADGYYHNNQHQVIISDETFKAAIFFSRRDTNTKFLPDVANALLDSVRSRAILDCPNDHDEILITPEMIIKEHAINFKKFDFNQLMNQFKLLMNSKSLFNPKMVEQQDLKV